MTLNETNVNDNAPVFEDGSGNPVTDYTFSYPENSAETDVLGTVGASDADGDSVTYTITNNVQDGSGNDLFEIDQNTGDISLTAAGAAAFANDYELASNTHSLTVQASDGTNTTDIAVTLNETNVNEAPTAEDTAKTVDEAKDSASVSYVLSASDFGFFDVDSGDTLQAVKITAVTTVGTLYLNGTAVSDGDVISRTDIDAGNLIFVPIDTDDSASNDYTTSGIGDQHVDYAKFDYQVSDGTNWSSNTATMTIDINAVADTPTLDLSSSSFVAKETIDASNINSAHQGFTITALNPDGSVGSFATNGSPSGFGVAGAASGANSETGYVSSNNTYEQIVLTFDSPVDSVDLSLAWNASNEDVAVAFYNNGTLIETVNTGGGSDGVDPAVNFKPSNGSVFDEIRFYPPNAGDDFLIHSISFDKTEIKNDGTVTVKENSSAELGLSAALTDTDGSEALTLELQGIPSGFTVTDGTNSFTSDGVTTSVDVTSWDVSSITLEVPNVSSTYTYTIDAVATSTEYSNGSTASVTKSFDITVLENTPTAPTISADQTVNVSEEGLTDGIADTVGNPDTTNATVVTGQFSVADVNGDTLNVTASVSGSYTSNGQAITWNWDEATQTLLGSTASRDVMRLVIDDAGAYTATLLGPIDHSDSTSEDTKTIPVTVTVSDGDAGTSDATSTLNVVVEDDAPVAVAQTNNITINTPVTNLVFIVDASGSMSDSDLTFTEEAMDRLINEYGDIGDVNINIVEFRNDGSTNSGWIDSTTALGYTVSRSGGNTSIEEGLKSVVNITYNGSEPAADQNIVYYFGDGDENSDEAAFDAYTAPGGTWETFVTSGSIDKLFTYSVNSTSVYADIATVADNGENVISEPAVNVNDIANLETFVSDTVGLYSNGNLLSDSTNGTTYIEYGADGGNIASISLDGTTVNYNSANITQSISGAYGIFTVNFDTGEYTYQATSFFDHSESLEVSIEDNDGDVVNAVLVTVNVDFASANASTDNIISNVNSGDSLTVDYSALIHNDNLLSGMNITNVTGATGTDITSTVNDVTFTDAADGESITYTISDGTVSDSTTASVTLQNTNVLRGTSDDDIIIAGQQNTLNVSNYAISATVLSGSTYNQDNQIGFTYDQSLSGLSITSITLDLSNDANAIFDTEGTGSTAPAIGASTTGIDSADVSFTAPDASQTLTVDFTPGSFTQGDAFWFGVDTDNLGTDDGAAFGSTPVELTITLSDGSTLTGTYQTNADGTSSLVLEDGNALLGFDGHDTLVGNSNNEYLDGGAGNDQLLAGTGNDTLVYDNLDSIIDGGLGIDTLIVTETGILDFSNVDNMEQIDLSGNGVQDILGLGLDDILNMSDNNNTLTITGDLEDNVGAIDTTGWTKSTETDNGTSVTYVYSNGTETVTLTIDDTINSTVL